MLAPLRRRMRKWWKQRNSGEQVLVVSAGIVAALILSAEVQALLRPDHRDTPPPTPVTTTKPDVTTTVPDVVTTTVPDVTTTEPDRNDFEQFTADQQQAYRTAYKYCDDLQRSDPVNGPLTVVEYMKEREDENGEVSSDAIEEAEWEGCADGDSETPLDGSGIPYP
jgi:hypothetical protein